MEKHANSLDAVLRPIGEAKGLPNAHYIDPQTAEVEHQKLFHSKWAAIGFGKDVPGEADAVPVEFLGMPLLLVRGRDNKVRVFQNTCRHRGMILVDAPRKMRGVIRCPYHSWCYSLDGKLKTTPHVGGPGQNLHEDIDRDALGLIEIRSHIWQDIIFINLSGNAPDFDEYAGKLLQRWGEFEQPAYFGGADSEFELTVNCNWKLAVENYCESYHLPWIHPGLNAYSKLEDHYNILESGEFSGQGTTVYNPKLSENGDAFSNFTNLSSKWDESAEYIALYPNVLLGLHRDHRYAIILVPRGHETTVERVSIYYTSEEMTEQSHAELRRRNKEQWHEIFVEDIGVVEGMQRGRHGKLFDGGKFSTVMDEATWCFHQWVASNLSSSA